MLAEDFGSRLKRGFCITKNYPIFILDNGHGGIIDGEYQTKGKRSRVWADGRQLFEGEFNRDILTYSHD